MSARAAPALQRQYAAPGDLARQLAERDREALATERRMLALLSTGRVIKPETFGAAADPNTDSTAALNYAIKQAADVGGIVQLQTGGEYVITGTLRIDAAVSVIGIRSSIRTVASDRHLLRVTEAASDVLLDGITFIGNNTGTGGLATGLSGGHGVVIDRADGVTLRGCKFQKFGVLAPVHGNWASPIHGVGCAEVSVLDCQFEASCWNRTGADILISGANLLITGNRSKSHCDAFVSLGDVGTDIRHIITGNFAYRDGEILNRSGILAAYGSTAPSYSDISHNQIEGFDWFGVYATGDDAGAFNVSSNVIRYCGGADADGGTPWPGAGIRVAGTNGSLIEGNTIFAAGYKANGDPRDTVAAGVFVYERTLGQNIRGNSVSGCSGSGIRVDAANAGTIENIIVEGNNVFDNDLHGIEVIAQVTNTECIINVSVRGNSVRITAEEGIGISCSASNGGWYNQVQVLGNTILHSDPPSSGFVGGIQMAGYSDFTRYQGSVCQNEIRGFRRGVRIIVTTLAHLFCPYALLVDGNKIDATFDALSLDTSTAWGLHSNTITNIATGGRTRAGRTLGVLDTSRPRVEFLSNVSPPDAAWLVGDRVIIQAPSGGIVGRYCSVAGSPGTWSDLTA